MQIKPTPVPPPKLFRLAHDAPRAGSQEVTMFKLAVVGPIVSSGFGVARQCITCYRSRPSYGGAQCFGFGPGCIEYRPHARERITDRDDKEVTWLPGRWG